MKSSEICQLAINVVAWNYGEVQYRLGNTLYYADDLKWCNMTWGGPPGYYSEAWHADCLGFVRAMLCGWSGDKEAYAGGANIDPNDPGAYNCKYFNEAMFLDSCRTEHGGGGISNDFSIISPCSLLQNSGHVGLYVGEYQLNGLTYNTCECSYGLQYGGYPTWTDQNGQRKTHKDGPDSGSYWDYWGLFNLNGTDYGITEYDGGATGATGFGSELSKTEVEYYWDKIGDPSYDTLEALAASLYDMPPDVFECEAGYVYGEYPTGFDEYMMYLCASIVINYFMAWGPQTGPEMGQFMGGGYYAYSAMAARAANMKVDMTDGGIRSRKAIYLALLNPMQLCTECVGTPLYPPDGPPEWRRIYTQYNLPNGQLEQWALKSNEGDRPYDITGTGIRGGNVTPSGRRGKGIPIWMYLKPFTQYSQYRLGFYRKY